MFEISEQVVQIFAHILSTITILSCLFLKVPQIMHIRKKMSAQGIYVQAMLMEITGFSITTLYNYTNGYNMMTYLEYPIILTQIYVLLYFTLKYKGLLESPVVPFATVSYVGAVIAFALNILPKDILSFLVPFCTPLSGFAKVTYIYGIIKAGNADAVSLTTWIISVLTNMSRLFTVYVDSADLNLMFNFTVSSLLSSGVLFTAIYYQTFTKSTKTHKVTKKE
ncbi:solute carrier family 66 member 3 [Aricia agestis]|uniref:solute carrier family 66 member 3 n=1 Tax=Aricia agestis TaxID=91739 RepID=UPI001C20AEE8|nr:solute carrier family 66 member 3 [Aricia agestis]XP_041987288.1 solute carrier family 66 member 3 [Aricia agestis]XP_041987289.1 solute carrier family 66 member 3 [Aricia agestis]